MTQGVVTGAVGLVVLLAMLLARRKMDVKHAVVFNDKAISTTRFGILATVVFGVGMCMTMVWNSMVFGIVGIALLVSLVPICKSLKYEVIRMPDFKKINDEIAEATGCPQGTGRGSKIKNFACTISVALAKNFLENMAIPKNSNKTLIILCYDTLKTSTEEHAMFKILVVEDDKELNRSVCALLNHSGYEAAGQGRQQPQTGGGRAGIGCGRANDLSELA